MDPLLLFLIVFSVLFASAVIWLHRETSRVGGLKQWLTDLPTTNFRIFVSIVLAVFFVVVAMLLNIIAAMNPDVQLSDVVIDTLALFLFGMMGIDAASYIAKRVTHRPANGDDTPPGSTATMPTQGGTTIRTEGPATVQVTPPPVNGQ